MGNRTQEEATGYDLSTTGTIVEASCAAGAEVGWTVKGTAAADYVVEISGNDVDWQEYASYSSTQSVTDGGTIPEARYVRVRNTSTTADGETAEALLGVSE